jgi:hypothetical protein
VSAIILYSFRCGELPRRYLTGPGDGSWRCKPYGTFLLRGRSKHPTPSQLSQWREVEARLPELTERAIESIPKPQARDDPKRQFSRDTAELCELRLEQDGSIELFFLPTIPDHEEYPLSPVVMFKDWKIVASYWTP